MPLPRRADGANAGAPGRDENLPEGTRGDLTEEPPTSSISFRAGKTRANNGILELSRSGDGTFKVTNRSAGPVQLIVDVNGTFR